MKRYVIEKLDNERKWIAEESLPNLRAAKTRKEAYSKNWPKVSFRIVEVAEVRTVIEEDK